MPSSSESIYPSSAKHSPENTSHEDRVFRLAELLRSEIDVKEFEKAVLEQTVEGLNGRGGVLWKSPDQDVLGSLIPQAEHGQPYSQSSLEHWREVREEVRQSGQSRTVRVSDLLPENSSTESIDTSANVLFKPLVSDSQVATLLEIHQPREADLQESDAFLAILSELHAESLKNHKLRRLENETQQGQRFEEYACALQKLWNPADIYAHIIDGGRALSGFDRLTLLTGSGKSCRVQSVSTIDAHSRHSLTIQKIQELSRLLTISDQEIRYDETSEQILAPEVQEKLHQVLEATQARVFYALPLRNLNADDSLEENFVVGLLVAEHFRADLDVDAYSRLQRITTYSAPAVIRAAYWQNLPGKWFLNLWLSLIRSPFQPKSRVWKWTVIFALLLTLVLVFVPAKFHVHSTGQLLPKKQHHVFAPMKAIVDDIHFEEDQPIKADQLLLSLSDLDLNLKLEEVRGELDRVETRLKTIQTLRSKIIRTSSDSASDDDLAAEANELRKNRDSLESQWEILKTKESQLEIRSPIAGTLLTWNPQELLNSRPVAAGQILLTLADVTGDWEIDVKIPEEEMGHVRQALQDNAGQVRIEFTLNSQVGKHYPAILREADISRRSEIDPDLLHYFRGAVTLSTSQEYQPISGAGVSVRIHCGSRALGYVLFHDLYEWFQRNVLF